MRNKVFSDYTNYANGPNSLIYHLTSWPVVPATSFYFIFIITYITQGIHNTKKQDINN